jgi:hypothetical protein
LLIAKILVRCHKYIELRFCRCQQFPVVEMASAHLIGRRYGVFPECKTQRRGRALVKKYFHANKTVARSRD